MLLRQHGRTLVVHTPAKLNLFLEVLGKRTDGYHELETLMVSVGLYDTLRFTEEFSTLSGPALSPEIRLRCRWAGARPYPFAPLLNDSDNLVVKAARLMLDFCGVARGATIELRKRIPLAAGLAGGSSDAAATLVALNRLWGLGLPDQQLLELAVQLGSDIGFFLGRTPVAICRGRGERIEPVAIPMRLHFVISKPASGLLTASVFRHCQAAAEPCSVLPLVHALRAGKLDAAARSLHNALQAPAESLSFDVVRLREAFSRLPFCGHQMSGSGTSYFGICSQREQAGRLAAQLRSTGRDHIFVASTQP